MYWPYEYRESQSAGLQNSKEDLVMMRTEVHVTKDEMESEMTRLMIFSSCRSF